MNIHEILEYGEIVDHDAALDTLVVYDGESCQALLFQGTHDGDWSLGDTLDDVDDDEESIEAAIDRLMESPE